MTIDWSPARYGYKTIAIHWITVPLIIAVFATMELKPYTAKGGELRETLMFWHYLLGLAVLAAVWFRVAARRMESAPPDLGGPTWKRAMAALTHRFLYALMFIMPVLGWLALNAKGQGVHVAGLDLPMLVEKNESLARLFKQWHQALANAGYVVLALHVLAVLYHQFVARDRTMLRMMPASAE